MYDDTSTGTTLTDATVFAGVSELWSQTLGDPHICIAIVDGPVDQTHPSLTTANLTPIQTLASGMSDNFGPATKHGTHIASIIFGQHEGPIKGIAPCCRGLIVPIFTDGEKGTFAPCSELDLARAITQALENGAHVINVSGGELSPSGTAHPLLSDAIKNCAANGVLIVAAAGNDGCACVHVPGALPSILAVGAMNSQGEPLDFSNWGDRYQVNGVLAPGENILGASLDGGTVRKSGTSYATAVVSGIAALLLSVQVKLGRLPNPHSVRSVILSSTVDCRTQPAPDCRRLLAGRLNVSEATSKLIHSEVIMSASTKTQDHDQTTGSENVDKDISATKLTAAGVQAAESLSSVSETAQKNESLSTWGSTTTTAEGHANQGSLMPSKASLMGCGCGPQGSGIKQLVNTMGLVSYDWGSEARRDSFATNMNGGNPDNPKELLAYFEKNPWDSAAIIWTLKLDGITTYAIQPQGAYAREGYQRLRQFLGEQLTEGVERVLISGFIVGQASLISGQVVPVIFPELRGMYSWTTSALIDVVCGKSPSKSAKQEEQEAYMQKTQAIRNFLERVYHELRNLGISSQERAINYAATNAFTAEKIFEVALKEGMELDTIDVERSPLCRPESDCWDVKLTFFDPEKQLQRARKVYRYTVDVSDVCCVAVGPVRSWYMR